MSGILGLVGLLFALVMGGTLAWFMLDGDRKQHRRQMEALQKRIERKQAEHATARRGDQENEPDEPAL